MSRMAFPDVKVTVARKSPLPTHARSGERLTLPPSSSPSPRRDACRCYPARV